MTTYVLIFLLWSSGSSHADGMSLLRQEFTSRDKCEAAGTAAIAKFAGWGTKGYYICAEK